jgi:iron(II)-dependent oxidoreductase
MPRLLWCIVVAVSIASVAIGVGMGQVPLAGLGAIGLAGALVRFLSRRRSRRPQSSEILTPLRQSTDIDKHQSGAPDDACALVDQMLALGRYSLLLRPQLAVNLVDEQYRAAVGALETEMALVPDGDVVLGQIDDALEDGRLEDEEVAEARARVVQVEHFFLDRYPVTNNEFHRFVVAGGYEDPALWDESMLAAILHFVDSTGHPGPAFWKEGRYAKGRENHPVVGVSWFEACAYARWVGKRLPTDAEWVKAGCWPVPVSPTARVQRKYPWGDSIDLDRANLWGSGRADTVPVEDFAQGVSVGGVYQLIGNVWEWTRSDFRSLPFMDGRLLAEAPMKSIRGGAFDTYFDTQATCQFQSGEAAVARKRNIGFRCAIGVCDLMLSRASGESAAEEPEDVLKEEVCV